MPDAAHGAADPAGDVADVIDLLERGNREFVIASQSAIAAAPTGTSPEGRMPYRASPQRPVAAVLGCSDARAPVGQIFGRGNNELFVVRVAGQVLGDEILASLCFAAAELETLRVMLVLGHRRCAAVAAAVNRYLGEQTSPSAPDLLAAVIGRIQPAVELAHQALGEVHGRGAETSRGWTSALTEMAVTLNAAMVAGDIGDRIAPIAPGLRALCAVYDIDSHLVLRPSTMGDLEPHAGIESAPDASGLVGLAHQLAGGPLIAAILAAS